MRYFFILYLLGIMLMGLGMSMLFPVIFAIYFSCQGREPLLLSFALSTIPGFGLYISCRGTQVRELSRREGILIVMLCWFCICLFGSLPYVFSPHIVNLTDCIFESVSGFTTTGASILSDIESLPRAMLIWRDMTQWLGGMGMIVLALAILPLVGSGGMQLYRAEVPGPVEDKLQPRIKDTAKNLWKVYVFFTALGILLLCAGGMDFWEAISNVFGSISTGGFNPRNTSIGYYQSTYLHLVIIGLMLVGGINFSLHYWFLKGKPLKLFRNTELKFYLIMLTAFTMIVTLSLYHAGYFTDLARALQVGAFQIVSLGTATGFVTANYETWTPLAKCLILLSMFGIGCGGSTSGGIKSIRSVLLFKSTYKELLKLIHPKGVFVVKLEKKRVSESILNSVWGFIILYIAVILIATVLLATTGEDLLTSFSAAITCLGNVGPGLGNVGPTDSFLYLKDFAKWVLILCMLLGRLEIYSILVLFLPSFWIN